MSYRSSNSMRMTSPPREVMEEKITIEVKEEHQQPKKQHSGIGMLLFWLILVFIIVFVLLALFAPSWVVNPSTGEVDWGKVALTSFIVALIVVIIVWLVQSSRKQY